MEGGSTLQGVGHLTAIDAGGEAVVQDTRWRAEWREEGLRLVAGDSLQILILIAAHGQSLSQVACGILEGHQLVLIAGDEQQATRSVTGVLLTGGRQRFDEGRIVLGSGERQITPGLAQLVAGGERRDNTGAGIGGAAAVGAVQQQGAQAGVRAFVGGRCADDATANDDHIRLRHAAPQNIDLYR